MENQILVNEICPTTSQDWIKNGALLIDVREKEEVAQIAFDVKNILNIPLSEFEERFTEIPKDTNVIIACKSGGRSLRATGFLMHHRYTNVVNLQHGINKWIQKGFPIIGKIDEQKDSDCCGSTSCC